MDLVLLRHYLTPTLSEFEEEHLILRHVQSGQELSTESIFAFNLLECLWMGVKVSQVVVFMHYAPGTIVSHRRCPRYSVDGNECVA